MILIKNLIFPISQILHIFGFLFWKKLNPTGLGAKNRKNGGTKFRKFRKTSENFRNSRKLCQRLCIASTEAHISINDQIRRSPKVSLSICTSRAPGCRTSELRNFKASELRNFRTSNFRTSELRNFRTSEIPMLCSPSIELWVALVPAVRIVFIKHGFYDVLHNIVIIMMFSITL